MATPDVPGVSEAPLPDLLARVNKVLLGTCDDSPTRPWLAWLVVVLCRQRARQDWLAAVARDYLDSDEEEVGEVPGLPDWTYDFHGRGLCLTGPCREVLDVDFYEGDDGPQTIDAYFFATRIRGLTPRPGPERRLLEWFGDGRELLHEGLRELRSEGIINHPTASNVFHLHPWLERTYARIAAVDFEDAHVWARWSRGLGDATSKQSRNQGSFVAWATGILDDRSRARVIEELAPLLPRDAAIAQCHRLFDGPVDSVTGSAVRSLRQLGAKPGAPAFVLASRLDPEDHNPFTAVQLAECFFDSNLDDKALDLIQPFARQRQVKGFRGNPFDAAYAILALRFAPAHAPPLVRQALRSRVPDSFKRMAALLAVLDAPWCRRELLAAAEDEDVGPTNLRFLIGCLMQSADDETCRRAQHLLPPPPDFTGAAVGYTHEEVSFLNLKQLVDHQLQRARDTAALIRPS